MRARASNASAWLTSAYQPLERAPLSPGLLPPANGVSESSSTAMGPKALPLSDDAASPVQAKNARRKAVISGSGKWRCSTRRRSSASSGRRRGAFVRVSNTVLLSSRTARGVHWNSGELAGSGVGPGRQPVSSLPPRPRTTTLAPCDTARRPTATHIARGQTGDVYPCPRTLEGSTAATGRLVAACDLVAAVPHGERRHRAWEQRALVRVPRMQRPLRARRGNASADVL